MGYRNIDFEDIRELFEFRRDEYPFVFHRDDIRAPLAAWPGGAPVRVIDAGQPVALILDEHVPLIRLVQSFIDRQWHHGNLRTRNADPFDLSPGNIVTDRDLEMVDGLADEIAQAQHEREMAEEREFNDASEREYQQAVTRQRERAARDAREQIERDYNAHELARRARASGAPAGRVAVLEAIALDEEESAAGDGLIASVERQALGNTGTLPEPNPEATTFRSKRRPRNEVAPA